jgi:NADH:ubiquinone oxidoreductase subunit E
MSITTDNRTEVEATAKRVLGEKVVAFIESAVRGSPESAVRGSPDPAQAATEGLPSAAGDLRSTVSAGSETRAERTQETRAERDSQLIAVLHKVQAEFGYLAEAHLDAVAQLLRVPAAKVAGVASFYHYFRLSPRGKFIINVCLGTACYVKGADRVAQKLMDELGIAFGETSSDGIFTLEAARCVGTCGLAPVLMVGEEVHPQVTPDQVPLILEKYLDRARREAAGQASGG